MYDTSTQPLREAHAAMQPSYDPGYTGEPDMSPPAWSMPHSTTKVPALVFIICPLLPGHTTDDVATGLIGAVALPVLTADEIADAEADRLDKEFCERVEEREVDDVDDPAELMGLEDEL